MTTVDRSRIEQLLRALDQVLASKGATADIYLVGGAAIAPGFDAERSTRDVDAVFAPTTVVRDAAAVVADEFDLPSDWLNDAVKGFVPSRVEQDRRDLEILIQALRITSSEQALDVARASLGPS